MADEVGKSFSSSPFLNKRECIWSGDLIREYRYRVTEQLVQKTSRWLQIKSSVLAWPVLGWLGQSGTFDLYSTGGFGQAALSPCTIPSLIMCGDWRRRWYSPIRLMDHRKMVQSRLLIQYLIGPTSEPLSGLGCTKVAWLRNTPLAFSHPYYSSCFTFLASWHNLCSTLINLTSQDLLSLCRRRGTARQRQWSRCRTTASTTSCPSGTRSRPCMCGPPSPTTAGGCTSPTPSTGSPSNLWVNVPMAVKYTHFFIRDAVKFQVPL